MDSGRGGGGGRTPRGKKFRGSSRGRGQDSPARTPPTTPSISITSPTHESPSVTSSTPSPSLSTPSPRGVRDVEAKVTQQSVPSVASPKPTVALTSSSTSPTKSTSVVSTPPSASRQTSVTDSVTSKMKSLSLEEESSGTKQMSKDDVDKKTTKSSSTEESVVKKVEREVSKPDPPPPAAATPASAGPAKSKEDLESPAPPTATSSGPVTPAKSKEDLELQPPTPPPQVKPSDETGKKVTIESKVEQALSKPQQPRQTAKTWVVEPPKDVERSTTDAPLSVEIESSTKSGETGGDPSSASSPSQTRQAGRSGSLSLSPGYAYPLYGPVGKPGYIGGVGNTGDEETDSAGGDGRVRKESAIAAMESAVKGFTKRQWILLIMFGLTDFFSAVTISLQAPFYPAEAERKGATATEYGLVFGIFEFIVFLTSPIFGKYMNKLGPKTVFSVCILVTSVSVICFGLLDRIDDHTWFITLCFVCRIFEALGCGGFFTATFVIIAMEFPESVATTFASLETFFGLGLIVGPTVGGALFEVGGFSLPFFVVGACLLLTGLVSALVMPKIDRATDEHGTEEKGYGIWTILKIPSVDLVALSIASTSMSLGFVSATLEPHIRRFGLTPLQTGLVFVINGGLYALTAPLWGYICDYIRRPVYVTILGNLFIFISFILIGPADFIPFDTILWVTIVGLVIQGLGFGCCLVSGFIVGLKDSMKNGLPDNMSTYSVASGLWTSSLSLGAWVGPSLGGLLYDQVGFREGSWLILVTSFVVGITILVHTCATGSDSKSDSESQPLLQSTPISPLLGKKDIEESQAAKPSMSYGSTTNTGGGGDAAV